jgi:hypothetical protein
MSIHDTDLYRREIEHHYQLMLREAENQRLVQLALANRSTNRARFYALLIQLYQGLFQ